MKKIFGAGFALFLLLFMGAVLTRDRTTKAGITALRWCTDMNPARTVQTTLFRKLNPDLDVTLDPGARQKLIVQCSTGTGPDVIDVNNAQEMVSYVDAGILLDLTDIANARGFGVSNTYPAVHGCLTLNGRQYRFPCNVYSNAVIYNRAIFDDHGVPYPDVNWTYDQFIEAGRKIVNTPSKSGARHIPVANFYSRWFCLDLLVGSGGSIYRNQGLFSDLDSPVAIHAMQFYRDLIYKHHVITTPTEAAAMSSQGGWGSGGLNWFSSERAAMIFIGRWYLCQMPNFPELKGKLGAARLPRVGDRPSSGFCDTRAAGINVQSPHRKEAIRFLEYLASPAYGRLIVQDGDSMPPNPSLAQTGQDLITELVPDPAFHQVYVDALKSARPLDMSPFIDPNQLMRWLDERIGLVENDRVMPEEAMRSLAKEANELIRLNLERQPHLQRKYQEVTGKVYSSDWWK
jgi:multiple sugar transport system substrate-binding protein